MSSSMVLRPRKKARLDETSAGTQPSENAPTESPQDEDSIASDTEISLTKSSKVTRKNGQKSHGRRKSKLEVLGFPVDVMIEICKHLHPQELCALVRTCTAMRNFLLKRNIEKTVWEAAFKQATDLPRPPQYMSFPAFTHFLYAPFCHFCGAIARKVHQPAWLVRCCSGCLYEVTYNYEEANSLIHQASATWSHVKQLCTVYTVPTKHKRNYPLDYLQRHSPHIFRFLKADVDTVVRNLRRIRRKKLSDKEKAEGVNGELLRVRKNLKIRERRGSHLAAWFDKQENHRAAQLDNKRAQRLEAIIDKLRETGWDQEMDFIDGAALERLANLPVVRRSTKLTPSEWLQVSRLPELTGLLKEIRDARLYAERVDLVAGRLNVLEQAIALHYGLQAPRNAAMERHPKFVDFALGCTMLAKAPKSKVLTPDDFLKVLPKIATDWETAMTRAIVNKLRWYKEYIPKDTKTPLDLALVVFICNDCPQGSACMRFEDMLLHHCNAHAEPREALAKRIVDGPGTMKDRVNLTVRTFMDNNHYDSWALEPMQRIITALGLDPTRATAAELAACEGRLRCKDCAELQQPDVIYTWEAAMHHCCSKHWKACNWEAVSEEDLVRVRELEAKAHVLSLDSIGGVWACSLCIGWDGPGSEMRKHLTEEHGVADPDRCVKDGTVYLHPTKSAPVVRPGVTFPAEGSSKIDAVALPEISVLV